MWLSRSTSFGVVPLETSAWKPEMAPQAMVMNRNGNRAPANTGPLPSIKRETAGIFISGMAKTMPMARPMMTPIFIKVER
ncbi:Uncharacterised protein [Acinetobacter baumannii]|nr:Uncharacterised protein [Acinetobacter baumannii]